VELELIEKDNPDWRDLYEDIGYAKLTWILVGAGDDIIKIEMLRRIQFLDFPAMPRLTP